MKRLGWVPLERHERVCADWLKAVERIPLEPHEVRLVEAMRERRSAVTRAWTKGERATVAKLLQSDEGALIIAEMREYADDRLRAAVRAAAGSEPRALGFAHGVQEAAEVLASMAEFHAEEPGEQGSDHADARA